MYAGTTGTVYGLTVPADDIAVEADGGIPFPATFRITMAAIDPNAEITTEGPARATLKLVKIGAPDLDDEDDEDDEDYDDDDVAAIERRLGLASEDEDDVGTGNREEKNGGPSDPAKSKKARTEALLKALKEAAEDEDDEEMEDAELANGVNGKIDKGKAKALDEEGDDDEDEDEDDEDIKEYVICTLDPEKHYQQPLDLTISNKYEMCYFKVTGPFNVYLTGNFVIPPDADEEDEEDSDEDDLLQPDEIDEYLDDGESEEDELDDVADPRITELRDDDEVPNLIKVDQKKGKNKRPAEESEEDEPVEDDILTKILKPAEQTNGEQKLSKKQKKKLKNNAGDAVPAIVGAEKKDESKSAKEKKEEEKSSKQNPAKESPANGKKVQFAKNLEQGPTPPKVDAAKPGVKVVQGVTIDDKKIGSGKQVKKGSTVDLRYIGKLKDGRVFDANKKGKPFSFKVGSGNVVAGMDIGVQGMSVGGERRITIPARLGYGSKPMGEIPANSDLVFDIKLLAVN